MINTTTVYVLRSATDGEPVSYYPFKWEGGNITPPWGWHGYNRMEAATPAGALVEFKELQAAWNAALN
jgi:hypothetical protein